MAPQQDLTPSTSTPAEIQLRAPVFTIHDSEQKSARVQLKGLHDSSSVLSSTTVVDTRYQGVDSMTITMDSTEADLSSTKATLGSQTDHAVYLSTRTTMSGPNSSFMTADPGVPTGQPCASSTR